MTKLSKFIICENPMLDDERVFVIHARRPFIIAEVHHFDPEDEAEQMLCKQSYSMVGITELPGEYIVIGAIDAMIVPDISADEYAGIMRRMADWYRAYCEWEDEQL